MKNKYRDKCTKAQMRQGIPARTKASMRQGIHMSRTHQSRHAQRHAHAKARTHAPRHARMRQGTIQALIYRKTFLFSILEKQI